MMIRIDCEKMEMRKGLHLSRFKMSASRPDPEAQPPVSFGLVAQAFFVAEEDSRIDNNPSRCRSRLNPLLGVHEPLENFSVGRTSGNAGGSDIRAFAEMEDVVFAFFVDELDIGEVNMETADLQEVHTVLSELAVHAKNRRWKRPVAQGCRTLRFPDARYARAPTAS